MSWSANLVIGDSTLVPHAGTGLFHAKGVPLPPGAVAYLGPYRGSPIRQEVVLRGEGNLDYVFLEEDEEMGVDGKERISYAIWANHTSNLSRINAEIGRIGNKLILVLITALHHNGEIFVSNGWGWFLLKLREMPREKCIGMRCHWYTLSTACAWSPSLQQDAGEPN